MRRKNAAEKYSTFPDESRSGVAPLIVSRSLVRKRVSSVKSPCVCSSTPSTGSRSSSDAGRPSGISCVRQGASRPSRSTMRSTASFAMRRQVVSLPPVIVTSPELVSNSSALREMSTDFFSSPPSEISGRTPAYAPVRSESLR